MTSGNHMEGNELMRRQSISSMCDAWRAAKADIETAFALLKGAELKLTAGFPKDYGFRIQDYCEHLNWDKVDDVMARLKKQAWRVILSRIELRRVLSVKRCQELDKQLETGEGLPEIEERQIWAMLEGTLAQVNTFIIEAVKEVFEFLRPRNSKYWNNQQSGCELGNKVIIGWMVRPGYGTTYQVNYGNGYSGSPEDRLRALDNVMHNLDGKGTVKTTRGPLVDAINATPHETGKGETEYFQFRCFQNGNLHIVFKRLDLVSKINAIVGGMTLKGAKAA
jgi:hypothetical protein